MWDLFKTSKLRVSIVDALIFSKSCDYDPFLTRGIFSIILGRKVSKLSFFLIESQNCNILKFKGQNVQFSLLKTMSLID